MDGEAIAQGAFKEALEEVRAALEKLPDDRIWVLERGYQWELIRVQAILHGVAEIRARRGLRAPHLDESRD